MGFDNRKRLRAGAPRAPRVYCMFRPRTSDIIWWSSCWVSCTIFFL